jgi:formamidopyrimidine-DNA glycosylase
VPELPEVETVRKTLQDLILQKTVRDIDVFYDRIIRRNTPQEFKSILEGRTITDIGRYGKYLLIHFDDITLVSHLRMEGKFYYKEADNPKEKHEHIIFYFTNGMTLRYHDTRKFGTMDIVQTNDLYSEKSPLSNLGLEPFDKRATVTYFQQKIRNKRIPVKGILLDQTILTGLGNIYVDEVLFLSHLHPETKATELTKLDIKNILLNSTKVLNKAIKLGGTTIRSYTSSLGVTGRFQNELYVHMRKGEKCKVCNTEIVKSKVVGRGTYICPKCQKPTR